MRTILSSPMDNAVPAMRHTGSNRWLIRIMAMLAVVIAATWTAFRLSPWPSVWLIRWTFDRGSAQANAALAKHLPAGIVEQRDLAYDPSDPNALLDFYAPSDNGEQRMLMPIVWIHGGGFVSGSKGDIENYARILASQGFAVASVDYTIAPGAKWPTPTRQVNQALAYLQREATTLGIDPTRFVLAGDSAGAQIAAELANVITSPTHAKRLNIQPSINAENLAGTLLFCGIFDADRVNWEGAFAGFMRTVLWSYLGHKDFRNDPRVGYFSVAQHVTTTFPPAFISVGNADSLAPQSMAMTETLRTKGVRVQTLFFPADHIPPLPHEYQFNLDTDAGSKALEESVRFLESLHD